jgi:hypothetical protein
MFYYIYNKGERGEALIHGLHQAIDIKVSITCIATLGIMLRFSRFPRLLFVAIWVTQFKGPKKVADLLKMVTDCVNLMDDVFNADNAMLAQMLFDDIIVIDGQSLTLDFDVASFVNQLSHGFEVGRSVCHIGLDDLEHFFGGLVDPYKHAIVEL